VGLDGRLYVSLIGLAVLARGSKPLVG